MTDENNENVQDSVETLEAIDVGDVAQHPIMRDAAILPTRSIEELVNTVRSWLDYLLPGAIVWGNFRTGKTQAIRYLLANVEKFLGGKIPAYLLSMWDSEFQAITENRFYQEILYVLGYKLPESGTAAIKRRRVIDFMIERAREAGEHRILFCIDEAQWLERKQYRCLMDLHNQLKLADIRLIVILIGQSELLEMKEGLRSARQGHLVGRFMTCTHRFDGVVTYDDIRRMLWSLDEGSEYPTGSGKSYTAFFVPEAYLAGFRMEGYARLLWDVIRKAVEKAGLPKIKELPIQAISAILRTWLQELATVDAPELEITERMLEDIVYRVAFLQIQDHLLQTHSTAAERKAA